MNVWPFMKTLVWGFPSILVLNFWIEVNRSLWLSLHSRSEAVTTFINRDIMTVLATIFRLCPFESTALEYISDELDYDFLPLWKWLAHFRWCESSSICWRALLSAEQFSWNLKVSLKSISLLFTVICRLNVHHGLSHVNTCAPLACCLIFFGLIVFGSAFTSFLFRPRELQAMVFLSFENPWFEILKKKWTNLEISVEAGSSAVLSGMVETVIILSHFFMIISVDERQH